MYEKKPGDISIFRNDRKEKETHPDYRGVGLGVDGQKIKVALWLKKDRNGNTFMAGKIEPDTYEKPSGGGGDAQGFRGEGNAGFSGRAGNSQGGEKYDLSDDIPFITRNSIW